MYCIIKVRYKNASARGCSAPEKLAISKQNRAAWMVTGQSARSMAAKGQLIETFIRIQV